MKKYILAAALVCVSTSAIAGEERVVSGTNSSNIYFSKSEACQAAKDEAASNRTYSEKVTGYSNCDCDKSTTGSDKGAWICNVDARLEKKN